MINACLKTRTVVSTSTCVPIGRLFIKNATKEQNINVRQPAPVIIPANPIVMYKQPQQIALKDLRHDFVVTFIHKGHLKIIVFQSRKTPWKEVMTNRN